MTARLAPDRADMPTGAPQHPAPHGLGKQRSIHIGCAHGGFLRAERLGHRLDLVVRRTRPDTDSVPSRHGTQRTPTAPSLIDWRDSGDAGGWRSETTVRAVGNLKTCSACKKVKPLDEFYKARSKVDGLHHQCKPCGSKSSKARRERKRAANNYVIPVEKKCSVCKATLPADHFYRNYARDDNLDWSCKACNRLHKYNILPGDYWRMLESQGGVCAICKRDCARRGPQSLAVDHDHISGAVRGLLCEACNMGIGKFGDNPDFLRAAADYIAASLVRSSEEDEDGWQETA